MTRRKIQWISTIYTTAETVLAACNAALNKLEKAGHKDSAVYRKIDAFWQNLAETLNEMEDDMPDEP